MGPPGCSIRLLHKAPPWPPRIQALPLHRELLRVLAVPPGADLSAPMWPQRTYARRPRRPAGRLNHTPPPPGLCRGLPEPQSRDAPGRGSKGKLQMKILPKLKENVEATQLYENPTTEYGMQLNVAHQKNLQKSHINEDAKNKNSFALKESMTDLQSESNPVNTQISSCITSSSDISLSLLRSDMDFCLETTSFEDSLSSLSSPEIFRGGEFSDINDSTTEDYLKYKNSTFLDASRAVAIENMQQFSHLSAILDNSICKILPETEKTPDIMIKQTNFCVPVGKKKRGFLTSSPSSDTGSFEINLSPVQKLSSEGELNPNTSNYVYSDEIVPASSLEEEKDSWESQSIASEMCCIIKSSPGNECGKILCCCSKRVSKDMITEPVDKERLKIRARMNTTEKTEVKWREEVIEPRDQQTNSFVSIAEKNMKLLRCSPSTETGNFEAPCLISEMCCIVKTSPQIIYTKKPRCLPKGMSKDMVKKQVGVEKLKTKARINPIKESSSQWREKMMKSKAQLERAITAKIPCITTEMCCIVKTSPRIRCMKMPCCPSKRVSKDILGIDDCDD
ncbi:meiosis-specific kinetochore protein isoform X2 [Sarcophilus harrisii]|uniref:meiosis-specific kinetochore protein isoform X2 n=1 Tax=Sarcophilus harrisii TaxID=9305 RepID=UPI001301E7ED|nr:meiosis-specific kinetochore protein isoform X2 [Sarcophilus harrisii]